MKNGLHSFADFNIADEGVVVERVIHPILSQTYSLVNTDSKNYSIEEQAGRLRVFCSTKGWTLGNCTWTAANLGAPPMRPPCGRIGGVQAGLVLPP